MDENLALDVDLEDGAAPVADEEIAFAVESAAGSHAHAFSVNSKLTTGIDAIDDTFSARSNKQIPFRVEGEACGVKDAGDEGRTASVGADAHDGDRGLLAASAGDGGIDHSGTAYGGAGDGMKAVVELARDADVCSVCGAGWAADFYEAARGVAGDAKGETCGAAHENVGRFAIDKHRRRTEAVGPEKNAGQFDFAEGKYGGRGDVVDARKRGSFRSGLGGGASHVRPA